jgi:hypothetical protein
MSSDLPTKDPPKVFQAPALHGGAYSKQAKLKQESKQKEILEKLQMEKMIEKAKMAQRKMDDK